MAAVGTIVTVGPEMKWNSDNLEVGDCTTQLPLQHMIHVNRPWIGPSDRKRDNVDEGPEDRQTIREARSHCLSLFRWISW